MPMIERTSERLVLTSGSTTFTLDKAANKATLQRKFLWWRLKPAETSLSDIAAVTVDNAVDRASGVEVCHTMLIMQRGQGWAVPAADKTDAETTAAALRQFLGLTA
jgi:hypothetical protein